MTVAGRVQFNVYTTADGVKKEQLQIVADSVISAHGAAVAVAKQRAKAAANGAEHAPAQTSLPVEDTTGRPFNDEIPF